MVLFFFQLFQFINQELGHRVIHFLWFITVKYFIQAYCADLMLWHTFLIILPELKVKQNRYLNLTILHKEKTVNRKTCLLWVNMSRSGLLIPYCCWLPIMWQDEPGAGEPWESWWESHTGIWNTCTVFIVVAKCVNNS